MNVSDAAISPGKRTDYLPAFTLAHLFFCASEIRFRAAALMCLGPRLLPVLTPDEPEPVPSSSARACRSRAISASRDSMTCSRFMAGQYSNLRRASEKTVAMQFRYAVITKP